MQSRIGAPPSWNISQKIPSCSSVLAASINAAAARIRLSQWAEEAQVSVSDAYEALDVAAIAQALKDWAL